MSASVGTNVACARKRAAALRAWGEQGRIQEAAARLRCALPHGGVARQFEFDVQVGMVGINVPIPVPLAYHSFGGWKSSSFGDLNQHGTDSIKFWTRTKTVPSRSPSGITDGAEFSIPTMK